MNSVNVIGRLGSEPEMTYFDSGKCKTTLRLAVQRAVRKEGQPDCDWVPVEFWNKQAELLAEHVKKGHLIAVNGRMVFDDFTDRDGNKRTKAYVSGNNFTFLEKKDKAEAAQSTPAQRANKDKVNDLVTSLINDDEIPF